MRTKVEIVVCICLLVILYINLTSRPEITYNRSVQGPLIRLEVQDANH